MLLLLILYAFTLPLLVAAFVNKLWLAILIDIIAVQSYFALNEVARDLEDPFVYEPNDLPMARIQVCYEEVPSESLLILRPIRCTKELFCLQFCTLIVALRNTADIN